MKRPLLIFRDVDFHCSFHAGGRLGLHAMSRPLHVSRSTAQLSRRQSSCENGAYSFSSRPRLRRDESLNYQVSKSRRMRVDVIPYNNKSFKNYHDLHNISKHPVHISESSSKRLVFPLCGQLSGRRFSTAAANSTALENHQTTLHRDEQPLFPSQNPGTKEPKIREQLRHWEAEYRMQQKLDFHYEPSPTQIAFGKHDRAEVFDEEGAECDREDTPHPIYDKGDVEGFDNQRPHLLRGDMVELRAWNSFRIELAIFVQAIGSQYQYYTMSGKWIHQEPRLAKFCVPGFVDAQELDPILEFLPSKSIPAALQHKLQDFENALPRYLGSSLIKKMVDFWRESDKVYQDTAFNQDNAYTLVAHEVNVRYATLKSLAHKLLPTKYLTDGHFPYTVLYALHRSIMLDELGFQPQKWNHRVRNQFKITPLSEIELIRTLGDQIRQYQEYLMDSTKGIKPVKNAPTARLLKFIKKARSKIIESRRTRRYTPHGMIGPMELGVEDEANAKTHNVSMEILNSFDDFDWCYIRFIVSWAALRTIHNNSYLHGSASAILRAIGMYPDTVLDQRVGWTFLQEIGAIAPWANRTYFDMRLPSVISQVIPPKYLPEAKATEEVNTELDVLSDLRKDWGDLPVYCIDDIDAKEIDDGISIEPTDADDEYWVHIHVADPASMIEPRSITAQNAMFAARTTYFPDRVIGMLPGDIVRESLSLAPGRRCLTFSGRVNLSGKLLDTKITPGILRNTLYITPATLSTIIGEKPLVQETVITVGDKTAAISTKSSRKMTEPQEITNLDDGNLKLLHKLANARQSLSSSKGSIMFHSPSFQVSVTAHGNVADHGNTLRTVRHSSDPRIDIKVEKRNSDKERISGNTVMNLMLLAGEVGARWCQERGIPIINRVSQPNPAEPDPRKYFQQVISPLLNRFDVARDETHDLNRKGKEGYEFLGETAGSFQSQAGNIDIYRSSEKSRTISFGAIGEYFRPMSAQLMDKTPKTYDKTQDYNSNSKENFGSEGGNTDIFQSRAEAVKIDQYSEKARTIPLKIALEYQRLLGAAAPSTDPGPHLHLGLDNFARTTSPLRRASDLLVHWQIEAALLEEARLGESLLGSKRENYLPFKRHEIKHFLPLLDERERELNGQQREAQRVWAMQALLRAWKFKEAALPATFELWTHAFDQKTIRGGLTYFGGLFASFELPAWLREEDIQIGDIFEVKLADIDIYNRRITVTPLARIGRTTERTI